MLHPSVPKSSQRSWMSLAASSAVHAGLLVLVLLLTRQQEVEEKGDRPDAQMDHSRETQMVYLPPLPEPPPPAPPTPQPPPPPPEPQRQTPPPRPTTPPPPAERKQPEAEANAPPDAVKAEGEESDDPEGGGTAGKPVEEAAPTMESEARRIFGRPRLATRPGVGPRAVRPMESYIPDDASKCVPTPTATADSAGPVEYGTVEGRIFRGDNGQPLGGAHLQMVGTPYAAFTEADGSYTFRFDMALMDNCRTQYVRVTAKGYESRLLVLVVGANVRSEDVALKKRGLF